MIVRSKEDEMLCMVRDNNRRYYYRRFWTGYPQSFPKEDGYSHEGEVTSSRLLSNIEYANEAYSGKKLPQTIDAEYLSRFAQWLDEHGYPLAVCFEAAAMLARASSRS